MSVTFFCLYMSLSIQEVKKKKKRNYYFTKEVQDAIVIYNNSDNILEKNRMYDRMIHPAFKRLVEAIIKKYKFTYMGIDTIEDLMHEVEIHLLKNLSLFDPSRGAAYSYFGTATRRYLIQYNKNNYKKLKEDTDTSEVDSEDISKGKYDENEFDKNERMSDLFTDLFCEYLDDNYEKLFTTRQDMNVADAVIGILRGREKLDIFDKKSFNVYLKSMIEVSDNKIAEVLKLIKKKYFELSNKYEEYGYI